MVLDHNLFTLRIQPRLDHPGWAELIQQGTVITDPCYRVFLGEGATYYLLDPHSEALLGSMKAEEDNKSKSLVLESPPMADGVEMRSCGRIQWEWKLSYEGVTYRWRKDIVGLGSERGYTLYVCRKPDPDWPAAIYRPGKKHGVLQILDYNLARIDPPVADKKGLEIVIILTLLSFLDHYFNPTPPSSTVSTPTPVDTAALGKALSRTSLNAGEPSPVEKDKAKGRERKEEALPTVPSRVVAPTPEGTRRRGSKDGSTSSSQGVSINEILVKTESQCDAYCTQSLDLLADPSLLYLTLIAKSAKMVPHAIKLAEEVKRKRYKLSGEEIMQYVLPLDEGEEGSLPPIPSSGSPNKSYVPPTSIKIYLSRLALDELLPAYKPKAKKVVPDIRPPIVFNSAPATVESPNGKLKKGKKEEEEPATGTGFLSRFLGS